MKEKDSKTGRNEIVPSAEAPGKEKMSFKIITGDITKCETTAIVNAANTSPSWRRRRGRGHPPGGRAGTGRMPDAPRMQDWTGQNHKKDTN